MSQPLQHQVRPTSLRADALLARNVVLADDFFASADPHVSPQTRARLGELIARHKGGAHLEGADAAELAIIVQAVQQRG